MATNNFFGYSSHGEASYSANPSGYPSAPPPGPVAPVQSAVQPAQPLPAAPAGYARFPTQVTPQNPAYRAGNTAAAAYSAYQPVQAAGSTPFASSAPVGGAPVATAASYPTNSYPGYPSAPAPASVQATPAPGQPQPQVFDGKGVAAAAAATYYPRTVSAAAPTFSMSDGGPHFQARPLYSTNANVQATAAAVMSVGPAAANNRPPAPSSYSSIYSQSSSTPSYTYPAAPNSLANLKAAPAMYPTLTPVAPSGHHPPGSAVTVASTANWPGHRLTAAIQPANKIPAAAVRPKTRPPPKPQQLHYCEVCKISCAGPQTYKEHLEGQKHRKKEAASKSLANGNGSKSGANPKGGMSNLRCELCDVTCTGSDAYAAHIRGAKHTKVVKLHSKLGKPIPSIDPVVVSAGVRKDDHHPSVKNKPMKANSDWNNGNVVDGLSESEKEISPVGGDYIEEVKSENGKTVSFNCKLCDCKFNDPNAKIMHMKGRRHRLQYKKKVDPELVVDMKPSLRRLKLSPEEQQAKHKLANEEFWKRREEEFRAIEEEEKSYWEERDVKSDKKSALQQGPSGGKQHPMGFLPLLLRPETIDDRHVSAKHREIYPSEDDLSFIQKHVSNVEKSLKLVSDVLQSEKDDVDKSDRCLKGVMRVGVLAKGLLLQGDDQVELVVLCGGRPTQSVLEFIANHLPSKLLEVDAEEAYVVEKHLNDASLMIKIGSKLRIKVTITSPVVREASAGDALPSNLLNKDKCLEALATLRHAKWFQARASGRQSCIMVIRVLRDLCRTVQPMSPIKQFTLELLVEKVLASAPVPLSPGDAVRRVFESIAGGLLLPNSPGLLDPCEREPQDAAANLSNQQREEITSYAQHSLRLIAFRQIHKVLGIDSIPPPKFSRTNKSSRKRKQEEGEGDGEEDDDDESETKKEKLE